VDKEYKEMQITPLASGSSGNSFLIQSNGSALLVDAGLSGKQIVQRLEKVGFDPASLAGILVSHGHSDHVKGVGVLSGSSNFRIDESRHEARRPVGKVAIEDL
jgi:phosphoribosyl 1,2-cyclic phosphodiesterase